MRLFGWQVDGVDYEAAYEVDPKLVDDVRVFDLIGD